MVNGTTVVEKMPTWEEWQRLDEKVRDYELFKVLKAVENFPAFCRQRNELCEKKYVKQEFINSKVAIITAFAVGAGIFGSFGIKEIGKLLTYLVNGG